MLNEKGLSKLYCHICDKAVAWVNVIEIIDPDCFVDFLCGACIDKEAGCCIEVTLEEPHEEMEADEETNNRFSHLLRSAGIHKDSL